MSEQVTLETVTALKKAIKPLGGDLDLPAPRHLGLFWERCAQVLQLADPTMDLDALPRGVIVALAPVILGEAAWGLLRKEPFRDWEGFQRIVEDNFGLSE